MIENSEAIQKKLAQKKADWDANKGKPVMQEVFTMTCPSCKSPRGTFKKTDNGRMIHVDCPKRYETGVIRGNLT